VVHLAAPNEIESEAQPLRAVEVTTGGTAQLVAAAVAAGVGRLVYLSTAHVYGAPLHGRLDERSLTRPVHPYAITHRAAEDFVLGASGRNAMSPVVIRLSNAVGPPADSAVDRWSLLANDLCRQAVTERKLVLKSPGLQPRDFVPMADVCRAIEHLLLAPAEVVGDGLFNVGAGESLRVIDLAERIRQRAALVMGSDLPILRPDHGQVPPPPALHFDVARLRASGFVPRGPLMQELDRELDDTLRFCQAAFAPT
jgi:UDP-glucose 4-epimerase